MNQLIPKISALFPEAWHVPDLLILALLLLLGLLILGGLFRLLRGKESDLNQALSAAVAIVFLYGLCAVLYPLLPGKLTGYLSNLPFVSFRDHALVLFSLTGTPFSALCHRLVSLILLAFWVHLLNLWIPRGKHILSWYLLRFLSVALAVVLHYFTIALFNVILPGTLSEAAPTILVILLAVMLLMCLIKLVLGVVLTIASPILGAIYAFFFSHRIGKQLSKAVLTTVILTGALWALENLGITLIPIASTASPAYVIVILCVLVLWYLTGHIF